MYKLLTILGLMILLIASVSCNEAEEAAEKTEPTAEQPVATAEAEKTDMQVVTTESGLQYIDHVVGEGAEAITGMTLMMHYTGWLKNEDGSKGTKFDSSRDRNQPFRFTLGGNVIAGWNEGILGMKAGGQRELIIPSELGYGERGAGGAIPPGADLIFDVEFIEVAQ